MKKNKKAKKITTLLAALTMVFGLAGLDVPAAAGDTCTETNLRDCFDPDTYTPARESNSADDSTWCKTWSTGGFACSGSYMMGVYTLTGTPSQIVITTTCGAVDATVQNGTQIEEILATYSQSRLDQMSAEEIRDIEYCII